MSVQLLGKRELKRLGSVANDGAGAGYTSFAKGMMAKMGWAEGQGLGKDMQGRSTYVQVKKKDDNAGLGKERAQQNAVNDQWYFNAFDSALAKIGGKKKKKSKKSKSKKEKGSENEGVDAEGCFYDKMFKATGGARMGMRARASQNGKLARTEGGTDGVGGGEEVISIDNVEATVKLDKGTDSSSWSLEANAVVKTETAIVKKKIRVKVEKVRVKKEKGLESKKQGSAEEEVAVPTKKKRKRKDVAEGQEVAVDVENKRGKKSEAKKAAKQAEKALKKEPQESKDDGANGSGLVEEKVGKTKKTKGR